MTKQTRDSQGRFFSYRRLIHFIILTIAAIVLALTFARWDARNHPVELINPLIEDNFFSPKPVEAKTYIRLEGEASWYGTGKDECLGCNANRIMSNGQKLDDTKNTVACGLYSSCKQLPLWSKVKIINLDNMMTTTAIVTDRGSLRPGRILDVSISVKKHLNMAGLANVQVTRID